MLMPTSSLLPSKHMLFKLSQVQFLAHFVDGLITCLLPLLLPLLLLLLLPSGSWSKSSADSSKANDGGQGPGSAAAATAAAAAAGEGVQRGSSSGSGPVRTISHRHTTSFTAVMDPSGLNIIEDYALQAQQSAMQDAQQQQQQHLPQLAEEQAQPPAAAAAGASPPAAREKGPFAAAAAAAGEDRKADGSAGAVPRAAGQGSGSSRGSPARDASPGKAAGRSSSPLQRLRHASSSKQALSEADAAEVRQPLLSAGSTEGAAPGDADTSVAAHSSTQQQGAGQGQKAGAGSRPTTPVPGDDASVPPLLASSSPVVISGARQQQQGVRSSKSVSFSRSPATPDSSGVPLGSSHSASALLSGGTGSSGRAVAPGGAAASSAAGSTRSSPLARRSASPMVYSTSHSADVAGAASGSPAGVGRLGLSAMSASYEALSVSSGSGSGSSAAGVGPLVEPGEEDADEVLVEVFEHERVQPFRGWGHTWPGHFLPSDKVGHWGDRSGAPGGAVSMLFDRVAPKLPTGWAWQDEEWVVDMTGEDVEGCDAEGWSYGMDFSWLMWPPAPQSGRAGIKSFVRRRRWVRTRARLAPGDTRPPDEAGEVMSEPVLVRSDPGAAAAAAAQQGLPQLGPSSSRDSEGGFMAGLSSGLGLVGGDASAAAAAAGAMVSRFMKAVSDLPLAPRGSSAGSELGLSFSPPTATTAADRAGAAGATGGPGGMQAAGVSSPAQPGQAVEPAAAAAATTAVSGQQQLPGGGVSSKSSNAGSSRRGGDSGNMSDSDSSSVGSDSPPPRPRLSEALADLQREASAGLPQQQSPPAAAATTVGAATVTPPAATSTAAAAAMPSSSQVLQVPGSSSSSSTAAPGAGPAAADSNTTADVGVDVVSPGGAAGGAHHLPAAGQQPVQAITHDTPTAGGPAAAGVGVKGVEPPAAADGPQEGLPAAQTPEGPATTGPQAPPTSTAPAPAGAGGDAAGAGAGAARSAAAVVGSAVDQMQPTAGHQGVARPVSAVEAAAAHGTAAPTAQDSEGGSSSLQPGDTALTPSAGVGVAPPAASNSTEASSGGGSSTQSGQAGVSDTAAVTALEPALKPVPANEAVAGGDSGNVIGSGLGAGADAETAVAAVIPVPVPAAAGSVLAQQPLLEQVGGSGELPTSPTHADGISRRGSGAISRTSSGGVPPRGVVRTGSGVRGSRGKQSKLGAVPLRRSTEGSTPGTAGSNSGAGQGGSTAAGTLPAADDTPSAPRAAAVVPQPAAVVASSSSGSGAVGSELLQEGVGPGAAGVALAPGPDAAVSPAVATPSTQQPVGETQVSSANDMGSGLGWANSPDKTKSAALHRTGVQQGG